MRKKRKIINLYKDTNTINVKHVISISSEEDLNNFWDYSSTYNDAKYTLMHTFITQFYNFALSHLLNKENHFFEIILEDSDKYIYFTLWNKTIASLFKKHIEPTSLNYLYDDARLSIILDKVFDIKEQSKTKLIQKTKVLTKAYNFVEQDDLDELLAFSDDMQELMQYSKKIGLHIDIFISLRSTLSMFCLTLRYYKQVTDVANTITDFSNLINTNKEKFINFNTNEISLIEGFISNIDTWLQTLFVKGEADLHFMDNSLKADYQMISQIITPTIMNESDCNLDDIFDF